MRLLTLAITLAVNTLIATTQANAYPNVIHGYELLVKDINEQPIEGASVLFTTHDEGQSSSSKIECVTDANGICKAEFEVKQHPDYTYTASYKSSVTYSVSKEAFYSNSGKLSSTYGSETSDTYSSPVKGSIVMDSPASYLSKAFISSTADRKLREQALKFISLIRLHSLIVDADIMHGSAGTSAFKGKKYFQMKINTTNTYNSLKLDKYGIAKRLFDDSIRKILNPLNDNISNPKIFYGYDLVIYGYTKSFANEYASPEKIEYRFLIPQDTVKRYKDKDISGQQLLDASVILMNDERIDLKLQ